MRWREMDKEKFTRWLEEKINKITYETPDNHLDTDVRIQLWRGHILALQEVKSQVDSGKFD
nr:hypothetical protein [Clostridioides sp.]